MIHLCKGNVFLKPTGLSTVHKQIAQRARLINAASTHTALQQSKYMIFTLKKRVAGTQSICAQNPVLQGKATSLLSC